MTGRALTFAAAAALGLAATSLTGPDSTAQAAGWIGHGHQHHGRFRNVFGYYATYPYDYWAARYALEPIVATPVPQRIDPVIAAVPGTSCVKSREILTVPSEDGGTRTLMVTRC